MSKPYHAWRGVGGGPRGEGRGRGRYARLWNAMMNEVPKEHCRQSLEQNRTVPTQERTTVWDRERIAEHRAQGRAGHELTEGRKRRAGDKGPVTYDAT